VEKQAGEGLEIMGVEVPGLLEVGLERLGAASGVLGIRRVGSHRRSPSSQTIREVIGP